VIELRAREEAAGGKRAQADNDDGKQQVGTT
jgi:hypothetical protein